MLSSLFSQSTLKAQPFHPYDDQRQGSDFVALRPFEDPWTSALWSDTPRRDAWSNGLELPTMSETMAAILGRVRGAIGRG